MVGSQFLCLPFGLQRADLARFYRHTFLTLNYRNLQIPPKTARSLS
nr:MAG TPA: hypothetical protein [Caudoviricetes sp.]